MRGVLVFNDHDDDTGHYRDLFNRAMKGYDHGDDIGHYRDLFNNAMKNTFQCNSALCTFTANTSDGYCSICQVFRSVIGMMVSMATNTDYDLVLEDLPMVSPMLLLWGLLFYEAYLLKTINFINH